MLVPLAAVSLHRVQLLGIISDARRRRMGFRTEAHGIGLLAELLHGSVLDEHRDEVAHGPVLQSMALDLDDIPNVLSREGREPRAETMDNVFQVLVIIRPSHLGSLHRRPTPDNHR